MTDYDGLSDKLWLVYGRGVKGKSGFWCLGLGQTTKEKQLCIFSLIAHAVVHKSQIDYLVGNNPHINDTLKKAIDYFRVVQFWVLCGIPQIKHTNYQTFLLFTRFSKQRISCSLATSDTVL